MVQRRGLRVLASHTAIALAGPDGDVERKLVDNRAIIDNTAMLVAGCGISTGSAAARMADGDRLIP